MTQAGIIETIATALRDNPRSRALFLSGSHGTGPDDAYSDIDFVLVAADGPTDAIVALWRQAIEQTGEIVLWWERTTRPMLINAITQDWTRTDVVTLKPSRPAPCQRLECGLAGRIRSRHVVQPGENARYQTPLLTP